MPSRSERHLQASPDRVFAVLTDPLTYPEWLLGAQRIRMVEAGWPTPGTSFHHEVGVGPLVVRDRTSVVEAEPARRLVLRAGLGRLGSAVVRFEIEPAGDGSRLSFVEEPADGPLRAMWDHLGQVLVWTGIKARNDVSLERLADLVERGEAPGPGGPTASDRPADVELIDLRAAAEVLGADEDGVERLVAAGMLEAHDTPDGRRVRADEVQAVRLQGG